MEAGDSFLMEQLASQLSPYVLVLIVDPLPPPPPSSNGTDIIFFCIWSVPGSSTFYLSKAYKYVDRWYLQCHRLNSTSCNPDGSSFSSPRMGYNHQKHGHSIRGLSKKKRCADHLWKKTQKKHCIVCCFSFFLLATNAPHLYNTELMPQVWDARSSNDGPLSIFLIVIIWIIKGVGRYVEQRRSALCPFQAATSSAPVAA